MKPMILWCQLLLIACDWFLPLSAWADNPNELTAEEQKQGFVSLFNGRDLQGWCHQGNWKVEDGAIVCARAYDFSDIGKSKKTNGGTYYRKCLDLVSTVSVPQDFELHFEWKGTPNDKRKSWAVIGGGRNGSWFLEYYTVRFLIASNQQQEDKYWVRLGYLFRTDDCLIGLSSDEVAGPNEAIAAGTMGPEAASRPAGHWNMGRIIWKGAVCQHWLNDVKTLNGDVQSVFLPRPDQETQEHRDVVACLNKWSKHRDQLHIEIRADAGVPSSNFHPVYYRGIKVRAMRGIPGTRTDYGKIEK